MSYTNWITDLNTGKLDPKYIQIMNLVDSIAVELIDDKTRLRMYADLRDTFINRIKEIKPGKKLFGISFKLKI